MKVSALLIGVLSLSGIVASAQEPATPVVEFGANYAFVHSGHSRDSNTVNQNGGTGWGMYNVNKFLGVILDVGAYHNGNSNRVPRDQTTVTYLAGPRFSWRTSRFTPYVQFLFGGAHLSGTAFRADDTTFTSNQNSFATSAGGGVDVTLTKHIALKPLQVEYLTTQFSGLAFGQTSHQNDLRYTGGVVFRFGSK